MRQGEMEFFEIPQLDRKKTQEAVENVFEKYRLFKAITIEDKEASVTASYSERVHGPTNVTSDSTANIAIHNVDANAARIKYMRWVESHVKRLHPKERLLIEERYMNDYVYDWMVYQQIFNPPISAGTYKKIRWRAFYRLALSMSIEVIDKDENEPQ